MAKCTVMYWQEVPSFVEARDADGVHKMQLSERFQELIDLVAMRRGLAGTDAYLMEWRKDKPVEFDGAAQDVCETKAAEIESRYEEIKSAAIEASG